MRILPFAGVVFLMCVVGWAGERPQRFQIMASDLPPEWNGNVPEPDRGAYGWWDDYRPPNQPEVPEAGVDLERGVVVWRRHATDPVFQACAPRKAEVVKLLKGSGCRGEYDQIVFELYAGRDLKGLVWNLSPLQGPGGSIIGKEFLDFRWVTYASESKRPAYLVSRQTCNIAKGTNQQAWLCFKIPDDAAPGEYHGEVALSVRAGEELVPLCVMPVRVDVHPFELVAGRLAIGFWYAGILGKSAAIDLDDMREMGMTSVGFSGVAIPYHDTDGLDFTSFESAMRLLQGHGFCRKGGPKSCWYNYSFKAYDSGYLMSQKLNPKKIIDTFVALEGIYANRPEWADIIVCLTDELGWEEKERLVKQNRKLFQENPGLLPKAGVRLTDARETAAKISALKLQRVKAAFIANRREATETLGAVCGAGYANFGAGYRAEDIERLSKSGVEFYTYNTWRSRVAFGYYSWKCSLFGARGNLQWGYGWGDEPFVVPIGKHRLHHVVYHHMAEGADDVRYLNTCEDWIRKCTERSASRAAQELLDEIAANLEVGWQYGPTGRKSKNFFRDDLCDRYRERLVKAILAMSQVSGNNSDVRIPGSQARSAPE